MKTEQEIREALKKLEDVRRNRFIFWTPDEYSKIDCVREFAKWVLRDEN